MRIRSRFLASLLQRLLRRRSLRGRLFTWPDWWWTLLGVQVELHGGHRGSVTALEYEVRSGRLRVFVALVAGARLLLDPEDLFLVSDTSAWEPVDEPEIVPTVEGG